MFNFGQGQGRRPAIIGINHRNILNISSPARRDEPDAEIGQISADFERGRFSKVSKGYMFSEVPVVKTFLVW